MLDPDAALRRIARRIAWLGVTALVAHASTSGAAPNIVLFVSDDQGWTGTSVPMDPGEISSSDFYETPQLERLAAEGTRFSQAYAPAPNCSPTRASLLTGVSPAALKITDVIENAPQPGGSCGKKSGATTLGALPTEVTTIAEAVKAADPTYVTAHFGKWHLGGGGPGDHGFDAHDGETSNTEGNLFEPGNPKDIFGVTARADAFIHEQVAAERPFFLQISHYAVHPQFDALPETLLEYESKPPGLLHSDPLYGAMTDDLDSALGGVLDTLDALGIADDTYVVYVSDHGAADTLGFTNNLPLSGGKATLYEGGTRVPMLVRGPGVGAGAVMALPVIGWDVFPTVLDWVDPAAPLPPEVEGVSLRAVLEGDTPGFSLARPRAALVWHFPHYAEWRGTTPQSSIRLGRFKLIRWYDTGDVELYDLRFDPEEATDLSADPAFAEVVATLTQELDDYLLAVDASMPNSSATLGGELGLWGAAVWLASRALGRRARTRPVGSASRAIG